MKLRGRTVILCCIALQICSLYSTTYEIVKYLRRSDHSYIKGKHPDVNLYLWIFSITSAIALISKAVLFGFGMSPYFTHKKSLVLLLCAVQFIIILPFNLSGFYLYYQTLGKDAIQMNPESRQSYEVFTQLLNENSTSTGTLISQVQAPSNVSDLYTMVTSLNEFYCCCGLNNSGEFGVEFVGNLSATRPETPELPFNFTCPAHQVNKSFRCNVREFEGCAKKLPRLHQLLIIVTTSIFTVCTVISIGLTIPLYSSFEFDRRKARVNYIRAWISQTKREIEMEKRERFEDVSTRSNKTEKSTRNGNSSKMERSDKALKTDRTQTEDTEMNQSSRNVERSAKTSVKTGIGKSEKSNRSPEE